MRPLRLYMKNFMNHSLTDLDLSNIRSVLIVGKNEKNDRISNGVGKTTIFTAIEWVLHNQIFATTLDKVVKDGKKKAIVEFDFELGGETYRIYRHRTATGSADVRLYKLSNGSFESISERTPSSTDAKIKDLIKISHKAFTYSILFRQADLTGISTVSDPKKRKEALKEPLNLSIYSKLEEMAVEKRRPLKKKIDNIEGSISILGDPKEDINNSVCDLNNYQTQIDTNTKLISDCEETIKLRQKHIDDLKLSLGQQDLEIHNKVTEQETLLKKQQNSIKDNNRKLSELDTLITSKNDKLSNLKDLQFEAQTKLNTLNENPIKDIEKLQLECKSISNDEVVGSQLIAAIKAKIKLTRNTLPEGDNCPTCQQSITEQYREKIEQDIDSKIKKYQKELDTLEDSMEKCQRKKKRLETELSEARIAATSISKLETQIQSFGNEQKTIRESIDQLYSLQTETAEQLSINEKDIVETTNNLKELKERAEKSDAPSINSKIFALKQEMSETQSNIKDYNKTLATLNNLQGGLLERIKNRQQDNVKLLALKEELSKVKRELKIRQMVVEAFSNQGIPSFIIQTVLDDLQFETNSALKELRPELDVQIDAELNFIYRRNGVIRDYEQLSHGQHVYIALAFKRGMARIIQKRLGNNMDIRMLEFDEVDSHLDDAGVDAFSDAIRKWQKDFTIFVITHNKDLKDKFSHAILVEEGEEGAEARLVSSW